LFLAPIVRGLSLLLTTLWLASCRDKGSDTPTEQPEPETRVSYSLEVRPFVIENCLSCHADFPLHDPSGWDLLHLHEGTVKHDHPDFLKKWAVQGSQIDPHWAGQPLHQVEGNSVDDFVDPSLPTLANPRQSPGPIFTAPVSELLAGDLMEEPHKAISTGYLRRGDDSPKWRIEKVAREFLGVTIGCAKCHDHPSEHWSTARYEHLQEIFTTPYDALPKTSPPLYVRQTVDQAAERAQLKIALEKACLTPPVSEREFQEWLIRDGSAPQIPGLVAAYSFDDRKLTNFALIDEIEENGNTLIADKGAHGSAISFDGQNDLSLAGVPTGTERDRFTFSAWVKLEAEALGDTAILTIGQRSRGFELRVLQGKLQARWTRVWPQHAITTTSKAPLFVPNRWTQVAVTYDGTRRATGLKLYLNGQPIETLSAPTELLNSVLSNEEPWRFFGKNLTLDEVQIYTEELTPLGVRQIFDGRSLTAAAPDRLRPFFQRHFDPTRRTQRQEIATLTDELLALEEQLNFFLVMADGRDRQIPVDSKTPRDRLDFAQRLNPDLLARALANEVWKRHFKTPLAHSLGFSDALPSHPELLEWLAAQLKQNGFNVAQLGETIRSSETWQREWPGLEHDPAACPIAGSQPKITRR